MRKLLFTAALAAICTTATAQQKEMKEGWNNNGVAGINMSQVSLSNWSAGGDGSVAFDLNLNYNANFKRNKNLWYNSLELAYGLNNTETNGTRKTNDKIYLSSTYGYQISKTWYFGAFLTYQSQFDKGYDYNKDSKVYISKFMAPGYLSAGPAFTWIPNNWFTMSLSPATWRGTFVLDDDLSDIGAFGVDEGKKLKSEFGGNATFEFKREILPNMLLTSRLNLFSNYLEKPQNVDVRWDTQLAMKINKWFSANLAVNLLYDDDTKTIDKDGTLRGAKIQFKEVLGVGLQAHF